MVIMSLEMNNIYCFLDFQVNFSYPRKIVNSTISFEYLKDRENFRYKRVNILMGSNASGKTALGRALVDIFKLIKEKNSQDILSKVSNEKENGYFAIEFVLDDFTLYRVSSLFNCDKILWIKVEKAEIGIRDSYEFTKSKLEVVSLEEYVEESIDLKVAFKDIKKENISWNFFFTEGENLKESVFDTKILDGVLRTLDTSIKEVVKSLEVENTYHIIFKSGYKLSIQEGKLINENILSSGTKEGIGIAFALSKMLSQRSIFYIDELFSHVHSELEINFLSLMIEFLKENSQLFFTTHNTDILEMNIPTHSFNFLKKGEKVQVIQPSLLFKKNDRSLANAVKNDLFDTLPNTDLICKLKELKS